LAEPYSALPRRPPAHVTASSTTWSLIGTESVQNGQKTGLKRLFFVRPHGVSLYSCGTNVSPKRLMENYDINRSGYHDTKDTMANIDLDYGAAVAAIAVESVARAAAEDPFG
jgi:hypothetical protein